MNEISDESRFSKIIAANLNQVRNGTHDGLFTAKGPEEKHWSIAHRVLLPALGPLAIRNMFEEMHASPTHERVSLMSGLHADRDIGYRFATRHEVGSSGIRDADTRDR